MKSSPKNTASFVRTVLGDVAADELGVCYAHEHLIIDDSVVTLRHPDLRLASVENGVAELRQFHADGGRAMIDSMPCDAGRNVIKLAAIAEATGVHIVCPTGLHLAKYYDDRHWSHDCDAGELAGLFIAEVEEGIDARDYSGPCVRRTRHRAGLIKIATEGETFTRRDETIFEAAAMTHRRTGVPILTHVEQGVGALQQAEKLQSLGVDLNKVVLSHTDRKPDLSYHREILSTGVKIEYDSAFRWKGADNPTLDLVIGLIDDFPDQIMLGMDAARPAYWKSYGGGPGLSFLLNEFTDELKQAGLREDSWRRMFVSNPAATYAFQQP